MLKKGCIRDVLVKNGHRKNDFGMCLAIYSGMIKRLKIMITIRGLTGKELYNG